MLPTIEKEKRRGFASRLLKVFATPITKIVVKRKMPKKYCCIPLLRDFQMFFLIVEVRGW